MNDYLDEVEAQLVELTERGAHRRLRARLGPLTAFERSPGRGEPGRGAPTEPGRGRRGPRWRTDALAVGGAVSVVLAVLVVALTAQGGGPSKTTAAQQHRQQQVYSAASSTASATTPQPQHHTATTPAGTTSAQLPAPAPAGFVPRSFTAIGEFTWWLLGVAPCGAGSCTRIVQTTDGGRSFFSVGAPGGATVSELRFGDSRDGYAFGPDLWSTHDNGRSWRRISLPGGQVTNLEIADGEAYAIAGGVLWTSPLAADRWNQAAGGILVAGPIWVHDTDVIVSTGSRTAGLISHTSAASFAPFPSPSKGLPCNYQEQARPVIWAQCATGMMSSVWRSANGGQSFGPAAGSARPGSRIELPNSAAFGAASSDVAVVGYNQLYRTADAGVTWAPVGPAGYDWLYLGFTDSTHGVALGTPQNGGNEQLWYTTDAGETYHLVNVG